MMETFSLKLDSLVITIGEVLGKETKCMQVEPYWSCQKELVRSKELVITFGFLLIQP